MKKISIILLIVLSALIDAHGYEKFLSKKGLEKHEGFITLYRSGKDIYLEIPDSLMGRTIAVSAVVEESSDPRLSLGDDVSSRRSFILAKTDSLILFQRHVLEIITNKKDSSIVRALSKSHTPTTEMLFPIAYRNADSTASVIKANDLFALSNKKIIAFRGPNYNGQGVVGASFASSDNKIYDMHSDADYFTLSRSFSAKLAVSQIMFGPNEDGGRVSGRINIRYSLLRPNDLPMKRYDSRMNVIHKGFLTMGESGGTKEVDFVSRWDFRGDKNLVFYVDTLLTGPYKKAAYDAIAAWNGAFEGIGLKNKIEAKALSAEVDIHNPYVSSVLLNGSASESVSSWIYKPNGYEFTACRINVPAGIKTGIYRNVTALVGDTDKRFMAEHFSDDAIYDYLYAHMLYHVGRCLGLTINYAASTQYSPEQLKSPEFTSQHGICPSAMVASKVNIYPSSEELALGAVGFVDRVGDWDSYTLSWLYDAPGFEFRKDVLYIDAKNSLLDIRANPDPDQNKNVLGNDPLAYCDAIYNHCQSILEQAPPVIEAFENQSARELFVDFVWLKMFYSLSYPSAYVGGMQCADIRQSNSPNAPRYVALPAAKQKKALKKVFQQMDRMDELDKYSKPLLTLAGTNSNFSVFNQLNKTNLYNPLFILPRLELACAKGGSSFTATQYIDMLVDYAFADVCKGNLKRMQGQSLMGLASVFSSMNHICYARYKKALDPGAAISFNGTADYSSASLGVAREYIENYPALAVYGLQKMQKKLKKAISSQKNPKNAAELEYIYYIVNSSLGEVSN